jgi:3D-(3,5/4)-trihydroxycyclohexane-1,2-dione acylhydrolase (decyclizing)
VWHVARPLPETAVLERAADLVRAARRPLVVAGGGVGYSGAHEALAAFCEATRIPVGLTQAGKGALAFDHPQCLGAIGATGTTAANAVAHEADLVIGVGTRYTDFTTASRTLFANPGVRFVNVNVAAVDAVKHSGVSVVADAREALDALTKLLGDHQVDADYVATYTDLDHAWAQTVDRAYHPDAAGPLTQAQVLGLVNDLSDPRDVVVCAAGSMPGDLHKLWQVRDPKGYHVEYGYSCMGYELPGGLGVKLACPDRDVFVLVGDGSYLMMPTELVTTVQEGVKLIVVLVQNHGFASIGALSESLGSQRFGTRYRYRSPSGRLDGDKLPVDLAANAASLGVQVVRAADAEQLAAAIRDAKASASSTVIHVETDPLAGAPSSEAWWDVPVSETSTLESTRRARATYDENKARQRPYLAPPPPTTA